MPLPLLDGVDKTDLAHDDLVAAVDAQAFFNVPKLIAALAGEGLAFAGLHVLSGSGACLAAHQASWAMAALEGAADSSLRMLHHRSNDSY